MQIGFAKRDITPPVLPEGDLSIPMLGFRWERAKAYRSVHDPLYARAMAVAPSRAEALRRAGASDAGSGIVISCDLFGDVIGLTGRCADEIQARCGVPADHVLFGCTHTHTSPDTLRICRKEVASWWIDALMKQIADAAVEAVRALRPGTLHWAEALAPGLAVNRRARAVQSYEEKHGPLDPHVRARNLAMDETLRCLCAVGADGKPFGAIVNFAAHPVIVQTAPMISADYCGPAAGGVEDAFGSGFISLYLNGPCGDINPACGYTANYADCERMGRQLAERSIRLVQDAAKAAPLRVERVAGRLWYAEVARQTVPDAPALRAQEQELVARCREADAAGIPPKDSRHPLATLEGLLEKLAVEEMPRTLQAPVHALRLGEVCFVSLPGEILTALGQDVRRGIGGKVMLSECSRAHMGYVCPREAYRVGGYETGLGTWSWLAEGAGEAIVQAAIEAAKEAQKS